MGKESLLNEVRELVQRVIKTRFEGRLHAEKAQAQAYADGYMRELIGEERRNTLKAA
jgi:hypothetical protein